jgi:heme/copper-type cytochrome/quinol oxidase subunit 3
MIQRVTTRPVPGQSVFAVRFFLVSVAAFALAGLLARLLIPFGAPPVALRAVVFPPAFWVSTLLLAGGSLALHLAVRSVRIERQRQFRRRLLVALAAGTLFVGVQIAGLWRLVQNQDPTDVTTDVNAFLVMLASLHGLHFTVALLFLVFVTLRAFADRYDHEYYFGVVVCAWFWHFLGAVWLAILVVFGISTAYL